MGRRRLVTDLILYCVRIGALYGRHESLGNVADVNGSEHLSRFDAFGDAVSMLLKKAASGIIDACEVKDLDGELCLLCWLKPPLLDFDPVPELHRIEVRRYILVHPPAMNIATNVSRT